jgi:hypothetical protein
MALGSATEVPMSYESNIAVTDHWCAGEDKTLSYEVPN